MLGVEKRGIKVECNVVYPGNRIDKTKKSFDMCRQKVLTLIRKDLVATPQGISNMVHSFSFVCCNDTFIKQTVIAVNKLIGSNKVCYI